VGGAHNKVPWFCRLHFTSLLHSELDTVLHLLLSTMPHPPKIQRIEGHQGAVVAGNDFVASFDDLVDVLLANILGCLTPKDIMRSRRINKMTMEAVKMTIVPPSDFCVTSLSTYNAMDVMTRAMTKLQQIKICYPGYRHKYNDGEDPDERVAARTATLLTHDIEIISNFRKLRILSIHSAGLNGRYHFLFNSFPLLQKLSIIDCPYLKFDLEMLAGFPLLKQLECINNCNLTGNINSLRALKDTLEKVVIDTDDGNQCIEGNFMDLADFPHLKELNLRRTVVRGDIRDIGENDFLSLEQLNLPKAVYGGAGYELQRISDGPDLIRVVYLLKKQRPHWRYHWYGILSRDSADRYESVENHPLGHRPPFHIQFVEAGSRLGYRWVSHFRHPCEVNWLDPEPDRARSDYSKYTEELQKFESQMQRSLFRGFHQPPTEEEFNRLVLPM
jgi:hypothetical protein